MTTITFSAEALGLKLSPPRIVMTRRGEREVRSAPATEAFWTAWRSNKEALKTAGFGVSKNNGDWEVSLWAETMTNAARAEAHEASRAADASIEVPVPAGCELMPFQKAGIAYALDRVGTLIGDDMGLGKTVQAVGYANVLGAKRILVVAPASVLMNWRNEIAKWQVGGLPITIIRPGSTLAADAAGWVVTNYDIVGRYEAQLKANEWDLVVLDEAQYLKTRTAKRTKLLLGGRGAGEPVQAKRKLLLTGTPIMNRPAELFPLIHYLDPKRWPTWTTFARRYCAGQRTSYGFDASGASNLDELNARLRETVMVRRLKADVLTELPAKRRQVLTMEATDLATIAAIKDEVQTYDRLEAAQADATYEMQAAEAAGDDGAYRAAVAKLKSAQSVAFSEMARVRHAVAVAKLPTVLEHLEQTEGKIIVFAHHKDVVDGLMAALTKHGAVKITGETPADKRQGIVEQFQRDPSIRFFVGNIKAAGIGITLTASSHVVFAELDWTPSAISQAEDRAHRIGQKDNVLVQHIVLDGSLDSRMAKLVIEKQEVIEQALDRRVAVAHVEADPVGIVHEPSEPTVAAPPRPAAAIELTAEQVAAIHTALRVVAGMDTDGAQVLNGVGFSKFDTRFGCELAERSSLSPRQAAAGMKLARKYRRQYSPEIYERIFGAT